MFKVLVVENEAIERKALIMLITKHFKSELSDIKEAKNGQDALEISKNYHPDIILMDIQMPVLDGLDASRMIKAILPATKIIILTAFDYFEYAKKAIQIQVVDYLLKPISESKLVDNINHVMTTLNKEKQLLEQYKNNSNQLDQLKPILTNKLLKEIIYKELQEDHYKHYEKLFELAGYQYVCVIFDNESRGFDETFIQGLGHKLRFIFRKVFIESIRDRLVCLLYFDEQSHGNFENVMDNIIREFKNCGDTYSLTLGLSKVYSRSKDIYDIYEEANENLMSQKYIESKIQGNQFEAFPIDVEVNIYEGLIYKDFLKVFDQLQKIIDYLDKMNDYQFSKLVIKQLCFMLHRNLIYKYGSDTLKDNIKEVIERIDECRRLEELEGFMKAYLATLGEDIKNSGESRSESIVKNAEKYLQKYYKTKACSLNMVAQALEISPSYLSRLFKKVKNITFKDYIIYLRMEEAKILLKETNMTTKEISQTIGYEDPNFFSHAFKKYVGIPATLYARKVR